MMNLTVDNTENKLRRTQYRVSRARKTYEFDIPKLKYIICIYVRKIGSTFTDLKTLKTTVTLF